MTRPAATMSRTNSGAQVTLQGQTVPAEAVNPTAFFAATRRKRYAEFTRQFAGLGGTDNFELRKSDILAVVHIRFSGTLTIVHNTGNVNATYRWPHDLIKMVRFTANGQSNLINCSGGKLKAREIMGNPEISDRGVQQPVGAGTASQGTLSEASESWGVGPGQTAIASGSYSVELLWKLPVAEDEKDLSGAIFAQTSAMDLTVTIDWNTAATLFTITGNDTVALTGTVIVEPEKYSIPVVGGSFVVPDLSVFHSIVQTSEQSRIGQGDNEIRLIGQGAGKRLIRLFFQVWDGAVPAPMAATSANYGPQGWRYGTNETPELYYDARSLRQWQEQLYSSDIAAQFGYLCHLIVATWAFRDTVAMGQTSELRLFTNIARPVTAPTLEYVQETVYSAGSAA